ncbi:hypothetical protein EVAR_53547_1 [Eumeta japonica]|uniref:Uncharacterized protein n=1 Tax=Eumeta variegata TaxID=151549 RepID=A0A4C1YT92_EUMVA|nr:hypothetical protein EVAR_53547_1 [Eumeta japonica]
MGRLELCNTTLSQNTGKKYHFPRLHFIQGFRWPTPLPLAHNLLPIASPISINPLLPPSDIQFVPKRPETHYCILWSRQCLQVVVTRGVHRDSDRRQGIPRLPSSIAPERGRRLPYKERTVRAGEPQPRQIMIAGKSL